MSHQSSAIEQHGDVLPEPLQAGVDPFIARTYLWFFVALAAMATVGIVSFFLVPDGWTARLSTADGILWVLCGWLGLRRPLAVIFPLFCLVTGLLLGQLAHRYSDVAVTAAVLSVVGFGGLSAYVHLSGRDFSFLRGALGVAFFLLAAGSIQLAYEPERFPRTRIVVTILGVAAFGGWILYDTSRILERADDDLTPGRAAFELFIDIVGSQRWLLDLLGLSTGSERDDT